MSYLIFSNHSELWSDKTLALKDIINDATATNYGLIMAVQNFIKDDNVLDEYFEDEHKSLVLEPVNNLREYLDIIKELELTEYSELSEVPDYVVKVLSKQHRWLYVIYPV